MTLNDLEYLGTSLAVLRRRTGKMQKDVSDDTGMSRSQVSRYERGRDTPNLVTLVKYLSAIGCDLRELHDTLQEIKALAGVLDTSKPIGLATFEQSLTRRLPFAPELREALVALLEPLFQEVEELRLSVSQLQTEAAGEG